MIYISDTSRIISVPKTRDLTGDLTLRLTNIMLGTTTVLAVTNTSTNPYVYKVTLTESQVRRLKHGEYLYEVLVGDTVAGQGLLRKPHVYDSDATYSNVNPDVVYDGNDTSVVRYRVHISASEGCSIVVNGEVYQTYNKNLVEGKILVVSAVPDEHYSFTSWSDGETEEIRTIVVEDNVDLYATAEIDTFTVAISAGDHGSVSVNGIVGNFSEILPFNTQLQVVANPNTGYEFYQWSDGNTNATRTITVTDNITLTSAFETEVYDVVITADAHCSITVNGVPGDFSGRLPFHSVVTLIATPQQGYNFTGWSDGDGASSRSILIEGNLTLTTSTQIQSFMVNIMSSDNQEGLVVVNGTVGDLITQCNYGTVLTLTTQPTTGYEFLMWSDGVIADQRTITVTDNVTLRATFAVQTFTVTVTPGPHSTVFVNGHQYSVQYNEENVPYGRNYVIEGRPDTGYSWVGWDNGSTTNPIVIHGINSDINLTSEVQVAKYWVRIEAGANGTISVDGVSYNNIFFQQINYGTTIQISGVADNGYDFDQWSDGDNTNPRTITVTGPVTLSASFQEHFEQSTRQIVYTSVSGQTVTPSANAYDSNDNPLTIISNDYSRGFGVITYSDEIAKLGNSMFMGNTDLVTVTVPDAVTKIDNDCFKNCSNLTTVNFSENSTLNTIESESFAYTALTSFTFPATVENVFWYVFNGVSTLSDIYVPYLPNFSGNNGSTFVYFNSYNGTLHTSYFNTFDYTYNEYWQNRLVNDYGWTVEYFEQFIDVSFGGMCDRYDGSTLQAYDANNNQLTVTSQYYSCGHTVYTFSGDVAKVDYLYDSHSGYNSYIRTVVMNLPHLTEIGDHMFSGLSNLSRIDIYNTTAPTVHSNTFKNVAINGTLNYPSGANYSTWLSVSDYYLGWYNWNDALSAHNVVYVKSNNINLTIDDQYLRDANDNQVSIQSHAFDGEYHKFVMNGQFSKITDGTANAGWIDPIYRGGVSRIKFTYTPNITEIGDYQWSGFAGLSEISGLFANVTTIGDYGFMGSRDTYDHTGFQSLTSIGVGAFKNARMQNTTVSGSFTSIPDEAFLWDGDANWETNSFMVKSSAGITYIGHNVFGGLGDDNPWRLALLPASGCVVKSDAVKTTGITNYGKVTIAHSFTDLDTQFSNTNATVTYFDELIYTTNNSQAANGQYYTNVYDSVSNIGDVIYDGGGNSDQFANCTNLVTVAIYGRTGYGQFSGCTNLVDADFTDCTYIGSECFDGTSLANIYIPATLTNIEVRPFRCNFKTLKVDANNPSWSDGDCNALIELDGNGNYGKILTIANTNQPPAGITGFAGWFSSSTSRTMALVVPSSVTVGFDNCCWLEECNISAIIYDGDPSQFTGSIPEYKCPHWVYSQYLNDCQSRWPNATWYVRPAANQIAYITNDRTAITPDISTHSQDSNGNQLVVASNNYTNQGLLTFTEDVYKLSYFTSADRSKLTAVVLPDGVNEIYYDAFEGTSINSLVVPGTVSTLYLQCVRNTNVESLCVPNSVVNAVASSVYGYYGKNIYFGSGLRYSAANNTFNGSILNGPNLESVDISHNNPYYNTIPGTNALFRVSDDVMVAGGICTTIPEGVAELASETYYGNGYLTTVTIPSTVTTIGNYCFGNCTHLAEIICLATTAPTIGTGVFNFTQSGVLKVPTGSNYSTWLSALSGWTVQYI